MNVSIIEAYFEFYKKSILNYNRLLLKYLDIENDLLANVSIEKIDKIVCECCKRMYSNNLLPEVINIDLDIILSLSKKNHPDLNLILSVLSKQIINLKELENNTNLIYLYRILSNSILIAIELNKRTCSIATDNFSFKNVISMILEEYGSYLEPVVVKKLKQPMSLLKDEYNKRIKIMNKLIQHYDNNKLDLEGFEICNISDQNKWYQIIPKYNFEKLKLSGKRKISTIVCRQNVYRDIIFILFDKINYQILKNVVKEKSVSNYIVSLPNDFLKTKTNTLKLIKLLDSAYSKNNIHLEIEYSQLKKYTEHVEQLKNNNISIIVTKINKQYSKEIICLANFVCLDKINFNDDKLLKLVKDNHIKIMFLQDGNDYPLGVSLVKNQNNLKVISREKMF